MKRSLSVEDNLNQVERPCKMSQTFARNLRTLLPRDDRWDGIPSPWEKRQLDLHDLEENVKCPSLSKDPPVDLFIDDFSFAVRGRLDIVFKTWLGAYSNIFEANEQAQSLPDPIRTEIVESKLHHFFPDWISEWNNSSSFFRSFFFHNNQMVRQESMFWFSDLGYSDDVLDLLLSRIEPANKS